jgi:replicative DNA helicase
MNKNEKNQQQTLLTKTDSLILSTCYGSPEFIVPGLIPVGLTILAGKPKSGKSLMAVDLANSCASGSTFLGRFDLTEADVLYFALEDSELQIQNRLHRLAADFAGTGRLHFATACCRMDQGFFGDLESWLRLNPGVKLVVVDTFNHVRRSKRRGTTPYEKDYNEISELKKFANDHGVSVLVVHHLRKSEAKDIADTIAGSIGITAAADAILILQKERGSNEATFFATGRDIPDFEIGLELNHESLTWELAVPSERLTKEREEILAILQTADAPMKLGQIATAVDKKRNNVHKLIAALIVAGRVSKIGYGLYEAVQEEIKNETEGGESGESSSIVA